MKTRLVAMACLAISLGVCTTFGTTKTAFAADNKKIIFTTTDLKEDYDIIEMFYDVVDVDTTFTGDPFEKGIGKALAMIKKEAIDAGGDAIVGFRIEIANFSNNYVGKAMVYGTVVKFKKAPKQETKPAATK